MSENLHGVYVANPITSNASTDLMYFMQSPYTSGTDAAMTYANFAGQFQAPLTFPLSLAQGGSGANLTANAGAVPYSGISALALSAVGSSGQLFISQGTSAPIWTTTTYPITNAINTIMYASSANVLGVIAAGNNGTLITSSGGVPSISSTLPTAVQSNITQLGTQSQSLNMGSNSITSVANPVNAADAVNLQTLQTYAQGLNPVAGVKAATTANLNATYSNGASGVGATLTNAGSQVAFATDGYSASSGDRILVWQQTSTFQNGIYTVTTVGSGSTNWVLTRATDYNIPTDIAVGDLVAVLNGTTYAESTFVQTATVVTIGTSAISFSVFFSPGSYTGSTSITTLGTITTGTWTGTNIALANGGSGASLTASNGGIVWSNASQMQILAGTATANQLFLSGSNATPSWSTSTYPSTNAVNTLLYASSANVMAALATANSSVLVTSAGGVPSLSTTLPSGLAATNLTLTTPVLGTPTSGTLTNCTGYTVANLSDGAWTDISGSIALTGFSGSPTITYARQKVIGKTCFFTISVTGTSNVDTFTITGMPKTANSAAAGSAGVTSNNGNNQFYQSWAIAASGTTLTMSNNGSTTGWATSGTKAAQFTGFYETT